MFSTKTSAAGLSVVSNVVIIIGELTAAIITGSVSVLAGAINSVVDLLAALIAFFSLRVAVQPADEVHPFGHGKVENISAVAEAGLLFLAAAYIVYDAVKKLVGGVKLEALGLGIGVMGASAVVNIVVSRHLLKVARQTDSLALEGDARHLTMDVLSSVGVMVGLVVVQMTGWEMIDPIMGMVVALLIVKTAWQLTWKSLGGLMDVRLPAEEEALIRRSIEEHLGELVGYHNLRTRKAGAERHIDLHLVMARSVSLEEAHRMSDHLEEDIEGKLPHSDLVIHIEPCEEACPNCPKGCPQRRNGQTA